MATKLDGGILFRQFQEMYGKALSANMSETLTRPEFSVE